MSENYPVQPAFFSNQQQGSHGPDTAQVQTWLNSMRATWPNLPRLRVDGRFGVDTTRAVRLFQNISGLPADGVVGKETWDALYERSAAVLGPGEQYPGIPVREGDRGAVVKSLQQKLQAVVPTLKADGDFGYRTRAAVSAFQTLNGLTADGIVGPRTYAKIQQLA